MEMYYYLELFWQKNNCTIIWNYFDQKKDKIWLFELVMLDVMKKKIIITMGF
jgi:hypothetical protein